MPVALEVSRSLHRSGARVVVVDSISPYICQSSRTVAASYVIPSPTLDFAGYKDALLELVRKEGIDLILPMTEDVFYISQFAAELPATCELFASDHKLLMELHHKQRFIEFAAGLGLAVPESRTYKAAEKIPSYTDEDYILKKAYSRAGTGIIFAGGSRHPETYGIPADGSWLMQERLKGTQYCSCTILDRGRIVAHVVYQPAVVNGTTSIVFRETHVPSIRNWIESFAEKTKFHGTLSFDFFVDGEGVARAIECNPRPTSGYHVMASKVLASALLERRSVNHSVQRRERAQILIPTLLAIPSLLKARKLWAGLKEIFKARDVIFDLRDCIPLLYQIPCAISVFAKAVMKGVPVTSCMMDGLEWDKEVSNNDNAFDFLLNRSEPDYV